MDTEATYNQLQGYAPTSALPDQSHQYTPVDIVPNFPVSSTPIGIPSTLTTASPASSDDPESPETFPCPDPACSKCYAQSQALDDISERNMLQIHVAFQTALSNGAARIIIRTT